MTDLHWTEIDQVATIWTDTPAPLQAGLLFRTGLVDETLAIAGTTHLIEHLSLSTVSDHSRLQNGFVGGVVTGFFTMGQPSDVSKFLKNICKALHSLPGDRLESEKQVLEAENASRRYDLYSNLLTWRYGANGYGLFGLPQPGLKKITLEQLQQHAKQRFTRNNAVLWLTGPPPDDLRLTLPDGIKNPIPPLTPIQKTFPCWYVDEMCGGVAAGVTVARSYAATIFCEITTRRLYQRLRTEQAVSYSPSVAYEPLNFDLAHMLLYADSDKSRREELAKAFDEVFQQLSVLAEGELESVRDQMLEHWNGSLALQPADRNIMEVQRAAREWILGSDYEPLESAGSQLNAITAEDVSAFARTLQESVIFALPGEARLAPGFGTRASVSTATAVQGRRIKHLDSPIRGEVLVYGADGVSFHGSDGSQLTVRYPELAAVLCYPDGALQLISSEAASLMIEPTLWPSGQRICNEILEHVPEQLRIDQGSRPAESIPMPTTSAWQRFRARIKVSPTLTWVLLWLIFSLFLSIMRYFME